MESTCKGFRVWVGPVHQMYGPWTCAPAFFVCTPEVQLGGISAVMCKLRGGGRGRGNVVCGTQKVKGVGVRERDMCIGIDVGGAASCIGQAPPYTFPYDLLWLPSSGRHHTDRGASVWRASTSCSVRASSARSTQPTMSTSFRSLSCCRKGWSCRGGLGRREDLLYTRLTRSCW